MLGLAVALAVTTPAWLAWTDPHLNLLWEEAKGVDDAKNHMLRLYLLGWLVERGVWYPRWVPDLFMGYGYPIFNYYAPGFYYLALLLQTVFRLDVWDAYRAGGVVAALLGAAGSYALTTAVWRRPALGVVAAATLLYGPYVFQTNLFQRGDLPEALGLALVPWLLLAIWRLWHAPPASAALSWLALAAAAGAAEALVHNLTAALAAGVAAVWTGYLLVARPRRAALGRVALAGLLATGLSAVFWLPAIGERGAVQLELLQEGHLDYRQWLLDPAGNTPKQQSPENRQTRAGFFDLHLRYPHQHQFITTLKPSLAQAGLAALALARVAVAGTAAIRARLADLTPGSFPKGNGSNGTPLQGATARRPQATRQAAYPSAGVPPSHLGKGTRGLGLDPIPPLLLVAALCWFLTFTPSAPLWAAIPGLAVLQHPGRLLGPAGVCIAVAGAGALAWPLAWLERATGRGGRLCSLGLAGVVGAAVLVNGAGDREVPLFEDPRRVVGGVIDGRTVVLEEGDKFGGTGTTSGGEFTPRDVQIAVYTAGQRRGRPIFERLYPERDWLGGLLYPMGGDLRLLGWRSRPLQLSVRVANDAAADGQLGIRQFRFPGWRAWIDGRPTPVEAAPYVVEQQATLGFVVVAVPPGEHTVSFAFGPTPPRLAGAALAATTWLGATAGLGYTLRRRRGAALPVLVAGWAVGAGAAGYLTWRGIRPMVGRYAALPAPAAAAVDGVWRADDLASGSGGLLVNVAEAARAGQARVSAPSGSSIGPDKFVDVRQLTVADADRDRGLAGTSRRQWLYAHPPAAVSVDVALPARATTWFQAGLALDPAVWTAPAGDGALFQLLVTRLAAGRREADAALVLERAIDPRAHPEQQRWVPVEADLSAWAGQTVRLTLRTQPRDDLSFDWAGWGNPVVVVRDFARVRPAAG